MRLWILSLVLLSLAIPATADVTVQNQSKVTAFVVLADKPIKKSHHALLKKFDYAGFGKHYPGHKIEQVRAGAEATIPWAKKGDGLVMTYVTGEKNIQQFIPFKLKKSSTVVVVKNAKKDFHIDVEAR